VRATAILAAVAALLALTIFLVERRVPSTDQRRAAHARLLPRFDRARVRRVAIARAGALPFALERAGGAATPDWRVLPAGKPADEGAVDELLGELDLAESDRDADLSPAEAGLEPPRVRLEIADGETLGLALGHADAGGRGVFVQAGGGGRVRVAPRRLLDLANRDAAAFRDHHVVVLGAGPSTVTWSAAGGPPRTISASAGRFRNERSEWVNDERATVALRRLADLRVDRFLDTPAEPPAIERTLAVGAGGGGAASETLRFGARVCPGGAGFPAERTDASGTEWLCLSAQAVQDLWWALEAAHARDDHLLAAAPAAVTRFALAAGTRRVALDDSSGRWRFVAPTLGYEADDDAVHAWLEALARVRLDFAPPPPAAPTAGSGTTLDVTTPRFEEHIAVAGRAVHRIGEPTAARGPADLAALVDPDPLRFRDRRVLNLSRFDAQLLRISSARRNEDLEKGGDQSWRAIAPAGATVDTAALDRLLATLTNLRVERYLPTDTKLTPDLTLNLTERPPGSAALDHALALAPGAGVGCRGVLTERAGTTAFVLDAATCDALHANVVR
jgi:hypothetical protein